MGFLITNRAFRFDFGGKQYAIDVYDDGVVYPGETAVHLFHMTANGWYRAHGEMEPVPVVTQATIDAAGGIEQMAQQIVAKINRALRILHGAGEDDIPAGTLPHERMADYLRQHLSLTVVDGVPVLVLG